MRIPDWYRKSTFFLCVEDKGRMRYVGTAFFVEREERHGELVYRWSCIATAKHSVNKALDRYGMLFARVNTIDGRGETFELRNDWIYPDDEGVDIAVLPYQRGPRPKIRLREDTGINVAVFVTDDKLKRADVGVGDDLFLIGLFTQRHGSQRNIPVLRTGVIAAMHEEPLVDDNTGREYNAYLRGSLHRRS